MPIWMATLLLGGTLVLATSGCGGGGGGGGVGEGGSVPPPVQNVAVGGIWEGTVAIAGQGTLELLGLIAEDGRAHFIQQDGVQYWGTVSASGTQISATISGATQIGFVFQDGSTGGNGTITGTISARNSVTATSTFTTLRGTRSEGSISLSYNSLYDRDSSLATIAGNYTNALNPGVDALNVSSNGTIFGQAPGTGCVVNGRVRTINSAYNAYDIEYTYSSCTGGDAILNGSTFRGIGTLDNIANPETVIAGVQGTVGGTLISAVFAYQRT